MNFLCCNQGMNYFLRLIFLIFFLTPVLLCACQPTNTRSHTALTALPQNILWAWERPEDLRWITPDFAIAYVAVSISLEDDKVLLSPRQNSLKVNAKTKLIPIVHVDPSFRHPPTLSAKQHQVIVEQVLAFAKTSNTNVVQLDFEVRRSQRRFLQEVVTDIRQQLPPKIALSITALASWCAGDYWLDAMPADEIVPMVFRMGVDDLLIRKMLNEKNRFPHRRCQAAIGFSIDEAATDTTSKRRYFFSPTAWKASDQETLRLRLTNSNIIQ